MTDKKEPGACDEQTPGGNNNNLSSTDSTGLVALARRHVTAEMCERLSKHGMRDAALQLWAFRCGQ